MTLTQLAPNVWAMEQGGAETKVMNLVKHPAVPVFGGNDGYEKQITWGKDGSAKIWRWGSDNLLPDQREALVQENNLVHELVATKMAVVAGARRFFYEEDFAEGELRRIEVDVPGWWQELEESTYRLTRMGFDELFDCALKNLFFHANSLVEFVRNRAGQVTSMEAWECVHARAEKQNARGYVENWYWCGDWSKQNSDREDYPTMVTPAYNYNEEAKQPKFVLHILDGLLHDGVYGIPGWWGSRKWVATSNKIPMFHESNIDNGYFIKLHVEMPKDYFADKQSLAMARSEQELKEYSDRESDARRQFMKKVNDLFTGAEGNKVLFTEYEIDRQLKAEFPGIKIKVLETNKADESMLKLFNSANEAVISAQGVHPSLASIQTQGKLSSGSELRNALNVYTAIKAPRYRRMLCKIYDVARRINAPGSRVKMGWKDIEVTNLDENPMGMEQVDLT